MLNVQTIKDMGTPKIIAIYTRDASTIQVNIWQTSATERKALAMSDVSFGAEIILIITRDVQSTKTYKIKYTYLSVWNNTLLRHKSSKPYSLNQK
jgi:hypothetical protein